MSRVLHDLQRSSPTQNSNVEPERKFPPYHAKQVMGGAKTRRHTLASAWWLNESNPLHNGRRVLGGTCALRFLSLCPVPVNDIDIILLANQTN